jgi:hypothetical protein
MAAQKVNLILVTVIGGNSRMASRKDMEQKSGLKEIDTSVNT